MTDVAREFVAANTWVFAAVSSGDKAELVEYNDIISELFA
jgi:hypothetical protein